MSPVKVRALIIIFIVLLIDQVSKFWVKTNMVLGESYAVFGDWFEITFVENAGMAFGLGIPGEYGKLVLSLFRIVAVSGIGYYLFRYIAPKSDKLVTTAIALIFAGALGNIIDSAFYGLIFNESGFSEKAEFLPAEGGYAGFLHGKVVDMLHFPISSGILPEWVPFWGGEPYEFFRPVFNIADTSISLGVLIILFFQKRFFGNEENDNTNGDAQKLKEQETPNPLAPTEEILPVPPSGAAPATVSEVK